MRERQGWRERTGPSPTTVQPPTTRIDDSESPRAGLAILDESIPAEDTHGDYWPKYDDLRSITCASDVTFVGPISGYTERLLTISPGSEDPDPARISDVLDGLVFTVDELLLGDVGGSDQLTVAFLALRMKEDGSPHSRVVGAPFGVIRPGIEQIDDPDGPLYLVYAVADEAASPFDLPACTTSRPTEALRRS